jgi:hypothetical protein
MIQRYIPALKLTAGNAYAYAGLEQLSEDKYAPREVVLFTDHQYAIESLTQQVAALRQALGKYGVHEEGCMSDQWTKIHGHGPCTCGLETALQLISDGEKAARPRR